MPNYGKKYYTYLDEFPEQKVGIQFCEHTIKEILKNYDKESLFRTFSSIAQSLGLGNDYESILAYQQLQFNIHPNRNIILIHRLAVNVVFQYLFSTEDEEFGNRKDVLPNDIKLLFLCANQLTEFVENETLDIAKSIGKKLFFTSIKTILFSNTKDDLQGGFMLFKKYYLKIINLNMELYNSVIKDKYGFEISDYVKILELIEQRNYPKVFELFDKYAIVEFNKTYQYWEARQPKFAIPKELAFLQKYPLIKINDEYLVTDIHNLLSSLFKNLYRTLLEYDNISFKGDFGKHIVEPTIIDLIKERFVDENVKALKVGSKKIEYGDFGLLYDDSIFLFEIKSSLMNDASVFTDNYEAFMKIFNDKFVIKEGIRQQVKKIQLIDNNLEHFCSLSGIDPNIKYTIYPIMLSFDESLMSICCNWYLSMRFEVFRKLCKLHLHSIKLANCHSTITFNELYRMLYIEREPSERLKLLKMYSDDINKDPVSISFYLQELGVFKMITANNGK